LRRALDPARARRRNARSVGGRGVAPVRARDRAAFDPLHRQPGSGPGEPLRLRGHVQPDLPLRHGKALRLGLPEKLRPERRTDRPHDRELPLGPPLEAHATMPVPRRRLETCRLPRRVAHVGELTLASRTTPTVAQSGPSSSEGTGLSPPAPSNNAGAGTIGTFVTSRNEFPSPRVGVSERGGRAQGPPLH